MKNVAFGLTILALSALTLSVGGQPKKGTVLNELMQKKLKNAQSVLEGLAIGDFAKIRRGADELIQISKTEEWQVIRSPRFEMHSNEFRRAAEILVERAEAKNLDGAALAYVELTLSCVRCHQHVREIREARLPGSPSSVASR